MSVLLGNGDGTFMTPADFLAGDRPSFVAIGDLNGNGKLDLAVANDEAGTVSVVLGNGDGTFQTPTSLTVGDQPHAVAIGDLNGDGKLDLVTGHNVFDRVSVLLGNGDGTFQPATNFAVGNNPSFVTIGDLNGDGKPDLATANVSSDDVSILLNRTVSASTVDHFKCYEAKGDAVNVTVDLEDQFGREPQVPVGQPDLFCNPVDKNGEGISNPAAHLTCYRVAEGDKEREVIVENQFGRQSLKVEDPELLCVPSEKIEVISEDDEDDDDDGANKEKD